MHVCENNAYRYIIFHHLWTEKSQGCLKIGTVPNDFCGVYKFIFFICNFVNPYDDDPLGVQRFSVCEYLVAGKSKSSKSSKSIWLRRDIK